MAKKPSFNELYNQWASHSEEGTSVPDRRNREAEGLAALEAYQEEHGPLTDDQFREAINQFMLLGRFETSVLPSFRAQAPVPEEVSAPVLPTENAGGSVTDAAYRLASSSGRGLVDPLLGEGYFDAAVDTAQAGAANALSGLIGRASASTNPVMRAAAEIPGASVALASGNLEEWVSRAAGDSGVDEDVAALKEIAEANTAAAKPVREQLAGRGWLPRNVGEGALDVLSTPSSSASLIGGPFGAVAMSDAYNQAYMQAVDAGVDSEEDRELWALSQAAPELVSFIPASKVVERLPIVGQAVERFLRKPVKGLAARIVEREGSPALKAAVRTINASLGEAGQETLTGGVQDVAAGVIGATASDELGELGRASASSTLGGAVENGTFGDVLWRSGRAGFLAGGGLTATPNVARSYAERSDFVARTSSNTQDNILAGLEARLTKQAPAPETAAAPESPTFTPEEVAEREARNPNVDRELFNIEQDIAADETRARALDQAFSQAEEEAALQREVEEEAGFRTIERQAASGPMADSLRGAIPAEVTPEEVAQERITQARAQQEAEARERARQEQLQAESERVKVINEVARRRESVAKQAAAKAAKEEKAQSTATRSERNKAIDALFAENPGLDDAQITGMLPAKLEEMRQQQAARSAPKEAPRARKQARKEAPRTSRSKPEVDVEALRNSSNPLDRLQAKAAERLGMSAEEATAGDFLTKVKNVAGSLARDSSRAAGAAERLIEQGKVVFAPNAEALGRTPVRRKGEYDINEGVTYVYTDYLKDGSLPEIMDVLSHETGHQGQLNDRDAREQQLVTLLGRDGVQKGAEGLRRAAANGNKFAQDALREAKKDTEKRREEGEENPSRYEDLELVAYAIGKENAARSTLLGTAGGAVRDVLASARRQVRDKLGQDVEVSLGELRQAMRQVLEEGAATDTARSEQGSDETLGMVYPEGAVSAEAMAEQEANNRVYLSEDGRRKFVLSDAGSRLKKTAEARLKKGITVPLSEALDHKELYRNVPSAANVPVTMVPVEHLPAGSRALYAGGDIFLADSLSLEGSGPDSARAVLLHEVQHYVQELAGMKPEFFNGRALGRSKENLDRATEELNDTVADFIEGVDNFVDKNGEPLSRTVRVAARRIRDNTGKPALAKALEINKAIEDVDLSEMDAVVVDRLEEVLAAQRQAQEAYTQEFSDYLANNTERDAFFTQYEADTSQEDIDSLGNPEAFMKAQDYGTEAGVRAKGRYVRGGQTLGRSAEEGAATPRFRNRNKLATALVSAIRNDKGLGSHVRDEVALAKTAPVEFEAKANRAVGQYDRAIVKQAKEEGITPEALSLKIRDELEGIADTEGPASAYQQAFQEVTGKYGEAGLALRRLRQLVDDLSADLINTYLDSGIELTPSEVDNIKKVAANLGRYVHRFYASRQGRGLGELYAKSVREAVNKAAQKGKDSLTEPQAELLSRYERAAKVVGEDIVIPDEAEIGEVSAEHLEYLYRTWIGTDSTGVDRGAKEDALLNLREQVGAKQIEEKTKAALEAILDGAQHTASVFYNRGEKLDTTIMQKRTKIPKEIRELMGEITDPAGALLNTVSKQAEYVARTKSLLNLRSIADPADLQPPGSSGNPQVVANNMVELKGETYGPLEGHFASPAFRGMIDSITETMQDVVEAAITNDSSGMQLAAAIGRGAGRFWVTQASRAKSIGIVGNLFLYPLNALGSTAMIAMNGNVSPSSYAKGIRDALSIVRYAVNPGAGLSDSAALAVKYDVVDNATTGDLKQLDLGKIEQVVREMSGKSPGAIRRKLRELGIAGREFYAMMDVWSKIANFHNEADVLREVYEADGQNKTDDEIYREAAAVTRFTNMSYSMTAPFIKAIERLGLTWYAPYLYEAHRVVLSNLYQGFSDVRRARDMNTPEAKLKMARHGMARMVGTGMTLGTIATISQLASRIWGDDEEDKRMLLPGFNRIADFIPIGKDEAGNPVLFALSRIDPIEPITDLYRAARHSDDPTAAIWEQFKENYVAPSLAGAAWDAMARTTGWVEPSRSRPRRPLIQQWNEDGWSAVMERTGEEDMWASLAGLVEARYLPGTARAWSETNPKAADGTMGSTLYNVARAVGARGVRVDPKVAATSTYIDYDRTMKDLRRQLSAYVENSTNPSAKEINSRLLDMREEEKEQWDNLASLRRGMIALGMTEEEAMASLKEAGVPKKIMNQLAEETYVSNVISQQSIKSAAQLQMKKARTEEDKEKMKNKWETAWEILSLLQGEE